MKSPRLVLAALVIVTCCTRPSAAQDADPELAAEIVMYHEYFESLRGDFAAEAPDDGMRDAERALDAVLTQCSASSGASVTLHDLACGTSGCTVRLEFADGGEAQRFELAFQTQDWWRDSPFSDGQIFWLPDPAAEHAIVRLAITRSGHLLPSRGPIAQPDTP